MTEVVPTEAGLSLSGFLDVRGVSEVRSALHSWLDSCEGDLLLDVRSLVAIDATGLALLVAVHRRALNQGRHLVLDGVGPSLARLLAVTRLHRVLTVRREPTGTVTRPRSAA
jgi:anti-sigma B factor antagonist